jgi:hypothetical protein
LTTTGALSSTVTFTWFITGAQYLSVTVTNAEGLVTGSHAICLQTPLFPPKTYLPLVLRQAR